MPDAPLHLVTAAAGGGVGGVARLVVERLLARGQAVLATVHHEDERAEQLRALGADVIAGDLTDPRHVAAALDQVGRVFFSMGVSERYLEATTVLVLAARGLPGIEVLVNMSQMTVSQMTPAGSGESRQQRLHFLAEHVIDWSGVPAVHIRPTVFLENPLFNQLAAATVRQRDALALPFGDGRTSPVAARDVADAVTAVLLSPGAHLGGVYELTGPEALDLRQLAEAYGRGLGRHIAAERIALAQWADRLAQSGLNPHVQQHLSTMARLHQENRYDRSTGDVERLTGHRAMSVEEYVRGHLNRFTAQASADPA
ncbi:NmrA family NAD(P)-binding protein [Sinosporangium siamense]|uniref:NAD(P)-dependent oxidoreductase n=1 Tax=Sinosporangium siamense TaxID=1367973 RepID=A0A919RKW3_9ACTN|nr:NAD(P)H-binding protein [Sinosporangium siamense]GII94274.1 NAD(P)-dependent oxidoreductase [Sinosporangium siamense]